MDQINFSIKEKEKKYPVFLGISTSSSIRDFLKESHNGKKIVVVTDNNVKPICSEMILNQLKDLNPYMISIPAGESSKSRNMKDRIEDHMLEKKFGRDTVIIAVGGGMIGDLAGFTASTYNRGISLIHVPTTLLAMVDSSIGGKTSVNTSHGKNLIGATYQPDAVFADLNFLETLPPEEFANGMAEIIKIAAASDKELFSFIEKNAKKILEKNKNALLRIIKRSIELKKQVVEKDEKEHGLRQILNFGHTVGHALESCNNYQMKHGHCVSIGMAVESKISELQKSLGKKESEKLIAVLSSFGLPTNVGKETDIGAIIETMKMDKKSRNQRPRFIILKSIGKIKSDKSSFSYEVDENIIKKAIELRKND